MAESCEMKTLISEYETLIRSFERLEREAEEIRQMEDPSAEVEGDGQVVAKVEKAQDTFMFQQMKETLGQVVKTDSLAPCEENDEPDEDAGMQKEVADAELMDLIKVYMQEEERHRLATEALHNKKAEVESMLGMLEKLHEELMGYQHGEGQAIEAAEEEEEVQEGEMEADLLQELRELENKCVELDQEKAEMVNEIASLEHALAELGTEGDFDVGEEEEGEEGMSENEDEQGQVKRETETLSHQAEWTRSVVGLLEDVYGVSAEVTCLEDEDAETMQVQDEADTESAQAGKSFLLTLTYPSQHVLLIKLLVTPCAPIKLVSAELSAPATQARRRAGQAPTSSAMDLRDILDVAHSLSPPEDLVFVAREVGLRLRGQATARTQIKELQKKYIVKQSESLDELTLTFPEGVVATFQLLPGYPEVPGSLRLTSLVGVGGWKDTELAVTCKEANACMLESQGEEASLTKLVEDLYQRITTLNNGEDSQA